MHLLICPGYHSPDLTHDFLQALLRRITPERLWVMPIGSIPGSVSWPSRHAPLSQQPLNVIAFSAGVVAAYPWLMTWQRQGGKSRFIAIDGWGMPLLGNLAIYRMSHDRWTHGTTYFPTPKESKGYFYADPAVEHLEIWQFPQKTWGIGTIGDEPQSMTAIDFVYAVLTNKALLTDGAVDAR
ncbi:MAG: hypothetical protein AAGA83_19980 [Cyanobacteria bacterium P01_F01_bin.116]